MGSPSRAARRRRPPSPSSSPRARRSSSATTSTAAPGATSSGSPGRRGIETRWLDLATDPAAALRARPGRRRPGSSGSRRPSNPHLKVIDIEAVAERLDAHSGARGERPLLVVDNTFASPALQRPLALGRRHRVPLRHEVPRRPLRHGQRDRGHDARRPRPSGCGSCRTRWAACPDRSTASSCCAACGRSRCGSSDTRRTRPRSPVSWPAATTSPGSATRAWPTGRTPIPRPIVAARQMRRAAGMVSFAPRDGGRHGRDARARAIAICESTRLFTLAESLGGVESLIELPAIMTHVSVAGSSLEVDDGADPPVGRDRGRRRSPRGPGPRPGRGVAARRHGGHRGACGARRRG